MTDQRRYTGRELAALLEQVRRELGPQATIHEANKVRSGGVAGFFATEAFEVIASGSPPADTSEDLIDLDREPAPISTRGTSSALLERAEAISVRERIELSRQPQTRPRTHADRHVASDVGAADRRTATLEQFGSTVAPIGPTSGSVSIGSGREQSIGDGVSLWFDDAPTGDFAAVLQRELEQPSAVELMADGAVLTRALDLDHSPATGTILAPRAPDAMSPRTIAFWDRLDDAERLTDRIDIDSAIVIVVGNVRSALAVAGNVCGAHGRPTDLVLMTEQTDTGGVEASRIRHSMGELNEQLRRWVEAGSAGVVVIDSALGAKADLYIERARSAGSRLVRLAVDSELTPRHIFNILQRFGGNVVVDLHFRADPAHVLNLIDHGVPVASVGGQRLDPGLLLALQHELAMSTSPGNGARSGR